MIATAKHAVKSLSNVHRPDGSPNVFLFSTPRSGSTWLMEWIWSQPGFKYCNEPLNLREPLVRRHLGISRWEDLFDDAAGPKLHRYFRGFCDGRLRFANPNPLRRYYRPITHRIVFKEIHAGVDRVDWFRDTFNGRIVYLLRHPIAVALSTEELPTLQAFLLSEYSRRFSKEEITRSREIADSGSELERRVLSWCLQNAVPLRTASPDWAMVTYEQMVLEPDPVIDSLAGALALPAPSRMRNQVAVASGVKEKSDAATRRILEGEETSKRPWLVEKWRRRVDRPEERALMGILELFGLDVYRSGEILPSEQFWTTETVGGRA